MGVVPVADDAADIALAAEAALDAAALDRAVEKTGDAAGIVAVLQGDGAVGGTVGGGAEIHLARNAAGALVLCGDAAAVDAADHHRVYAQAVLGEAVSGEGAQVAFGVHFAFHREAADDAADIVVAADAAVVVAVGSLAVGLAVVLLVGGVVHQDIAAVLGVDKTVDSLDGGAGQGVEVAVDVVHVALEARC